MPLMRKKSAAYEEKMLLMKIKMLLMMKIVARMISMVIRMPNMVILKISDDGLNDDDDVDDRDVNLCRLLMMTRQTTWSVLGSNL